MEKLSKKIKFSTITAAVIAGTLFVAPVHSGSIATAILDISNFKFTNAATGQNLNNNDDLTIVSGNNFGTLSADLLSVAGIASASQSQNIFSSPGVLSATGGSFNGLHQCQGDCFPRAEDNYALNTVPPLPTATYSYADHRLNGTSIDIDLNGDGTIDIPAGINASTIAEVELGVDDVGTASSSTGTNVSFVFDALEDLTMRMTFDFVFQALAYVDNAAITPSSATAGVTWNIELENLTDGTIQTFSPGDINRTSSRNDFSANFNELDNKTKIGSHAFDFNLLAGNAYQLGVTHIVQANATHTSAVPEPHILALLGLGFMGLAVGGRRRKQ